MLAVLHLIIIFLLCGINQSGAEVTVSRSVDYVIYGKASKITCKVQGETFLYWKHETRNKVLSEGENYGGNLVVTIDTDQAELEIKNVDETVAGNYSCVGSQNVAFFLLYIAISIDPTTCEKKQGLIYGVDDEIKCLVRAYPPPTLLWKRIENGTEKEIVDERFRPQPNGGLKVKNVREYDGGEYRLSVSIPRRDAEVDFSIQIYYRAEINRLATPVEIYSYIGNKNPIKLSCNASGYPTPSIELTKGDRNINYQFTEVIDQPGFYSVEFLTDYKDMFGIYTWTASNVVNKDILEVRLSEAEAPRLLHVDRNIVGTLGKDTALKCKATGKPYPIVTWFRNGRRLKSSNKYKILNEDGNEGELIITDTLKDDIGEYVCLLENMMGNVTGKPFIVSAEREQVAEAKKRSDATNAKIIIGAIVGVILVVIIIVDLFCCLFNNCGISYCLFTTVCGKGKSSSEVPDEKEKKLDPDVDKALLKKTSEEKKTITPESV